MCINQHRRSDSQYKDLWKWEGNGKDRDLTEVVIIGVR